MSKRHFRDFSLQPKKKYSRKKTVISKSSETGLQSKKRKKMVYSNLPFKRDYYVPTTLRQTLLQWLNNINLDYYYIKNLLKILKIKQITTVQDLMNYFKTHNEFYIFLLKNISILNKDEPYNNYNILNLDKTIKGFRKLNILRLDLKKEKSVIQNDWSKERKNDWIDKNLNFIVKQPNGEKGLFDLKQLTMHQIRSIDNAKLIEIFPNVNQYYINKLLKKLFPILKKQALENIKDEINIIYDNDNSKYRVFVVLGHGPSCSLKDLKTKYSNLKKNKSSRRGKIILDNPKYNNLKIISTQSFGNYSTIIPSLFISSHFNNKNIYSLLYNFKTQKEINLLKKFVTILYFITFYLRLQKGYHVNIRMDGEDNNDLFVIQYKQFENSLKKLFGKKFILDPVKYSKNNIPNNSHISFGVHQELDITGIFELTQDNKDDLKQTIIQIQQEPIEPIYRLGILTDRNLKTKKEKEDRKETIKFNKRLYTDIYIPSKNKKTQTFTLKQAIDIIYEEGSIKPDEKVVILYNSCRGIQLKSIPNMYNTTKELNKKNRIRAEAVRERSYQEMMDSLLNQ